MTTSHHHQCHCQPTPPTPPTATTTCHCTMCYTTAHYSQPPPPPDPLLHSISTYSHHHLHAPPQNYYHSPHAPPQNYYHSPHAPPQNPHHVHAPPQNHHNHPHDYYPPPQTSQIHQKSNLFQKYNHQETFQETPPQQPNNPTISSLVHRIASLESTLRRRSKNSSGSSSLRVAAARTIQTHFRAYLVRRSVTLRHLKELAFVKSSLNHLKSLVSDKPHFDSYFIFRESLNLLIKLDSIKGSDPMIRDGKKSISRELIRFMELIDEISNESELISVKNVRFSTNGKKSVILQKQDKFRVSGNNERNYSEKLKNQIKKMNILSLDVENPRIEALLKSQRVVKSQPKAKKNVSFDENGNVYRLIKSKHSHVSSDGSDSSNGDGEEVEEIGVSSKETDVVVEDDSSETSENDVDPRKISGTRIHNPAQKNQPDEDNDDEEDNDDIDDDEEDNSFVFSAPLPVKMEYRVDSVKKKQTARH
ncbi:BAG family molecular chaperone regulator 8, chloroplastic [Rutidosis leptorrhynchoides]|uniref:BAG family molecular chaperone regulator 8, chloroplastic n=1 Tax=Rutidosis leptorrhynchoides TaxID=125765 RepID=UPI003A9A1DD5